MHAKLRASACHGLMAYLMSLGMTLTLLGVTGLLQHGWLAAWTLLVMTGCLTLASLNRKAVLAAGCAALFAGVVWLMIGGAEMITEVMRALVLHMSGLRTALPMVAAEFTILGCGLTLAASWFVTQRSAGAYPALILLVLIAALLWLGNLADSLICLLPAGFICVTLLLRAGDDHTSTARVLPLAAVVTAIAFGCAAAGGATSPTLKKVADNLRQRIYDTFFYTQPRDVFSLASEGWYPQGLGQLGGPATPREEPVMAVITSRKTYLRGVVKNVYTGRTWLDDVGGWRYLWSAARFDELRTATFDQQLPNLDGSADAALLAPRTLQVRMVRDSASTLFVPQRIRSLAAEGDLIPYFNASSEIFATTNLELGDVWTMEAALFTGNDAGVEALIQAADGTADARWDEVCDRYLQLHEQIDQRVYDMAAQVTAGAVTPYQKALAIQHYLAGNYVYSLEVENQPTNQDFVSTFLIETKEGYCTYFATAMTVLARMAGLPARYVEGYVAYPDAEGMAIVTGMEGHAWTEVYFRGFGWVTFDATPTSAEYLNWPDAEAPSGQDENNPEQSPEPTEEPTPTPAPSDAPSPSPSPDPAAPPEEQSTPAPSENPAPQEAELPQPEDPPSWPWWLMWLLLALLILRTVAVQPGMQAKRRKSEFGRWLVWTQAIHDALRRQGLVRDKAESPTAFFERAEASGKVHISLQSLVEAENLMFYGHAAPLKEETAMARKSFLALYRRLNAGQKLLFQLQRIFLPASHFDITAK